MKSSFMPKTLGLFASIAGAALMLACGGGIDQSRVTGSVAKTKNPLVAQYIVFDGWSRHFPHIDVIKLVDSPERIIPAFIWFEPIDRIH
jgi:hypothetical protein